MKVLVLAIIAMMVSASFAESKKAPVFIDKFVPNRGCKITDGEIQTLHDRIVGNVVSSRKYEVVERDELARVQKEHRLIDAGMTDGDAPESNRLKAAGYCVYGKIMQCRNNKYATGSFTRSDAVVELQIRITNIANGHILAAKTVKMSATDSAGSAVATDRDTAQEAMAKAIDGAAKEVVIKLNDVAFPVYVMSVNNKFVTANISEEQVTPGDIWEAYSIGDELIDDQTGESDGYDEELVGRLRVSRPGPKHTKFEPATQVDAKKILDAWEEANELMTSNKGVRRPRMVLHKVPDAGKWSPPPQNNGRLPDMSQW